MTNPNPTRRPDPSEEGYILLVVIFMLAILIISLAVAVPKVREDIQRDREIETMHRGKQYIRAVQLYYRKFSAYPPNIDALVKTNEIRFLRRRYIDPTTGKDDWKPVLFGQNKTPTAMGFFGQPMAGSTLAGTGPSGGNGVGGSSGSGFGSSSSSFGTSSGSGFGSSSSSFGSSPSGSSILGSSSTSTPSTSTTSPSGTSATSGATGSTDTSSSSSSTSSTGTGLSGQTFGGAGIIGFSPASPKQSILVYKKKNHYNEWEFVYDPLVDQQTTGGAAGGAGAQTGTGLSSPGGFSGSGGLSSPTSTSSFGSTSAPTSPTTPTTPTTPQ